MYFYCNFNYYPLEYFNNLKIRNLQDVEFILCFGFISQISRNHLNLNEKKNHTITRLSLINLNLIQFKLITDFAANYAIVEISQ